MYYGLIFTAAVLYSLQFLFQQKFEEKCGTAFSASLTFSAWTSVVCFAALLAVNGMRLQFTLFSLGIALIYSCVRIVYSYASMKAFDCVNLSVYSMFAMLGGMLLPFAYGILWCREGLTLNKALCCGLIAAALYLTVSAEEEEKRGRKSKIYYALVFVLNGMNGVLSKIHQSNTEANVDSVSFLALTMLVTFGMSAVLQLITGRKPVSIKGAVVGYTVGFALFCGFGNLLTLIALTHLPASVQYPIITGGVMVFTLLISWVRREHITRRNIFATVLSLVSTILIAL